MGFSFSKLSTYELCPLKYKFQYVDKIQVPKKRCFTKGSKVHSKLEKYNGELKQTKDSIVETTIVETFFKSKSGKSIKKALDTSKTFREFKFGLNENMEPTKYSNFSYYKGVIDLLYIKDKTLYLIDYKTGAPKQLNKQSFNQLLSYALYFRNSKLIDNIVLKFIYVEHNIENIMKVQKTDLDNAEHWIRGTIQQIYQDTAFMKKPNEWCSRCEFRKFCNSNVENYK